MLAWIDCREIVMQQGNTLTLSFPLFGLIVATRAALGVGIGLLIAGKLKEHRRAVGTALVAVGAVTTVPALFAVIEARKAAALQGEVRESERIR